MTRHGSRWRDTLKMVFSSTTNALDWNARLVLLGGGAPSFTVLDNWLNLNLVETRTFPPTACS